MKMIQNQLIIKPDKVGEFVEALKGHMKWTKLNEPGCLKFDVVKDEKASNIFHLYELYQDQKAIQKHAQSVTLADLRVKFPEWLIQQDRFTGDLILNLENADYTFN